MRVQHVLRTPPPPPVTQPPLSGLWAQGAAAGSAGAGSDRAERRADLVLALLAREGRGRATRGGRSLGRAAARARKHHPQHGHLRRRARGQRRRRLEWLQWPCRRRAQGRERRRARACATEHPPSSACPPAHNHASAARELRAGARAGALPGPASGTKGPLQDRQTHLGAGGGRGACDLVDFELRAAVRAARVVRHERHDVALLLCTRRALRKAARAPDRAAVARRLERASVAHLGPAFVLVLILKLELLRDATAVTAAHPPPPPPSPPPPPPYCCPYPSPYRTHLLCSRRRPCNLRPIRALRNAAHATRGAGGGAAHIVLLVLLVVGAV